MYKREISDIKKPAEVRFQWRGVAGVVKYNIDSTRWLCQSQLERRPENLARILTPKPLF
jgi:hypothetical protein